MSTILKKKPAKAPSPQVKRKNRCKKRKPGEVLPQAFTAGGGKIRPVRAGGGRGHQPELYRQAPEQRENSLEDFPDYNGKPLPDAGCGEHPPGLRGAGQRHQLRAVSEGRDEPPGGGLLLYAHADGGDGG